MGGLPKVFYATVFNASQMDNIPELELSQKNLEWSPIDRAETLLLNSGASIFHSESDRAFYRSSTDSIHLPLKEQFKSAEGYYATALHELGHWSGHHSRLDRDLGHPFGSDAYAREELRAEIASMILGSELGIGHDPSQHTAYIKSWIRVLEDDPLEIFRASADAEKIVNHIFSFEQHQHIEQVQSIETRDDYADKEVTMTFENDNPDKIWLNIPFKQKEIAKAAVGMLPDGTPGIAWDKIQKCWYAKPGVSTDKISDWLPKSEGVYQDKAVSVSEEFKAALHNLGAVVTGEHPIMDGRPHRITTEGDKKGEKSGFYVAHLDGVPAGYIKNNRTGVEINWKSKGYTLTEHQKSELQAQALKNQQSRQLELEKKRKNTALQLKEKLSMLSVVVEPTSYMQSKEIQVHPGAYTDNDKKLTYIPATDSEGMLWTIQYIAEDGTKRFAKDSRKEGCFHVLGGIGKLADTPIIIIAEGYATAATIKEATEYQAVVSAFDSGNLKSVAKALREKYPHKPIIIAADDDKYLELTQSINPGKEKAMEAAKVVDGLVIIPIFAPNEQSENPKKFSDFNDMAKHSLLGLDGVKRQLHTKVKKLMAARNKLNHSRLENVAHFM